MGGEEEVGIREVGGKGRVREGEGVGMEEFREGRRGEEEERVNGGG